VTITKGKICSASILVIAVLLAFIVVLSSQLFVFIHSPNISKVTVSNHTVDNSYNNKVLNPTASLIQKNNKLYYKYQQYNYLTCGVYEISPIGSQRILCPSCSNLLYPTADDFFEYNNQIILQPPYGGVDSLYTINNFLCIKEKYCDLQSIDGNIIYEVDAYRDHLYCFSGESVYIYDNGTIKKVADLPQNIIDGMDEIIRSHRYYFTDDTLYFILPNKEVYEIYALNLYGNKSTKLYLTEILSDRYIDRLAIEDQYAIVGSDLIYSSSPNGGYQIHRIELDDVNSTELLTDSGYAFNCYNGNLYIYGYSTNNGLGIMDIKEKSERIICNDYIITSVFILDNKWIYFLDENHHLFRTNYNGNIIEKIFSTP